MKTSILLAIICFSLNLKAESIDFNALITEVEASIAQQAKTVSANPVGFKSRQPASESVDAKIQVVDIKASELK